MSQEEEKVRLGGMALGNGVLVHGPTSWACAIRLRDGELKVAAAKKKFRSADVTNPLLRGPAKLAEVFALLPELRRRLPEAELPFQRRGVLVSMAGATAAVKVVRSSPNIGPAAQELVSGLLALAPALMSLRNSDVAAYHGAEHISIGSYEHGETVVKEHERCGGHLVGPLVATTAIGNILAAKAPPNLRGPARMAASVGAIAASMEIFGWMVKHPRHPLARALSKPGHELQHRLSTAEPTPEQLEVAEAALAACLELEEAA
jgi:uncharacterized protein YqhQ